MSGQARALYLGSAGPLALVRCGWCGRRNCFDRRGWQWFEVAFCRRCWQAVQFDDLVMVSRWEGERLLMENAAFGGELRAHREVERVMRSYLVYYDSQPYWLWAPQTRRMAADLRRSLSLVEAARAKSGGAVGTESAARPESAPAPMPTGAEYGGDVYGLTEQEARALTYFATLPAAQRANVLEYLEVSSRLSAGEGEATGEVRTPALPGVVSDDEEEGEGHA